MDVDRNAVRRVTVAVLLAAAVTGALAFGAGALFVHRFVALPAEARADAALREVREANDRLLSAWNSGVQVPPPDGPAPESPDGDLEPVVEDWLSQWDGAGRAHFARKARQLARSGMDGASVVLQLDRARAATHEAVS